MTTSTMLRSKLIRTTRLLVAAIALTGISPTVLAADKIVVATTTVRFGDLNLEAEAGAQALVNRLHRAATKICRDKPTSAPLQLRRGVQTRFVACRDQALQNAVAALDHPLVNKVYQRSHASDDLVAVR